MASLCRWRPSTSSFWWKFWFLFTPSGASRFSTHRYCPCVLKVSDEFTSCSVDPVNEIHVVFAAGVLYCTVPRERPSVNRTSKCTKHVQSLSLIISFFFLVHLFNNSYVFPTFNRLSEVFWNSGLKPAVRKRWDECSLLNRANSQHEVDQSWFQDSGSVYDDLGCIHYCSLFTALIVCIDVCVGHVPRRVGGDSGCDWAHAVCEDPGASFQTDL